MLSATKYIGLIQCFLTNYFTMTLPLFNKISYSKTVQTASQEIPLELLLIQLLEVLNTVSNTMLPTFKVQDCTHLKHSYMHLLYPIN